MPKSELIVGLDIGTTKICAVVGEPSENGGMDIVGIGTSPSTGLRKGVVVNIEQTVQSIKRALEEAELMAGCEIRSVYAGIAGSHIKGFNSHGVIAVKGGEVAPATSNARWTRRPSPFRSTAKSSIFCRRNTSSTTSAA